MNGFNNIMGGMNKKAKVMSLEAHLYTITYCGNAVHLGAHFCLERICVKGYGKHKII